MAIKNSVALTDNSGREVPADNIIVSAVHFPIPTLDIDIETGLWDGTVTRYITYDLFVYTSIASLQALDDFIQGGVKEFGSGWSKIITDQEYADLLANGALAEVWLKDYIEGLIGGVSTVVDPYV